MKKKLFIIIPIIVCIISLVGVSVFFIVKAINSPKYETKIDTDSFTIDEPFKSVNLTTTIPLPQSLLLPIEVYQQKYALSCEAAAASSSLRALGFSVTEDQFLTVLPYDFTPRMTDSTGKITWGDPYTAYVGDYKGIFHKTGYGVYAQPIADAANSFGAKAQAIYNAQMNDLYSALSSGKYAVVWVPTRFEIQTVNYWYTPEGKQIPWIQHEHAMVFRGYDISKSEVYLMDVATGTYQTHSLDEFLRGWSYLGNQMVSIGK